MTRLRLKSLPENIRREIRGARLERGWSQSALGTKVGLAQRHISGIETGKIVPRYDTLIEILRVLNRDLVPVPRELLPAVRALVRDYRDQEARGTAGERSLYATDDYVTDEKDEDEDGEAERRPELGND
ncbi:MAG TPA: helix-turn-helix transcriptional regulator [Alphaproteobacteria bacterium]